MKNWRLLIGLLLGAGFAWLALRGVDLAKLGGLFQGITWGRLALGVAITHGLGNALRVIRWRIILSQRVPGEWMALSGGLMVGYLANNVLPARMGELVRAKAVEHKTGLSFGRVLASIFVEKLADTGVVALVLVLGLFGLKEAGAIGRAAWLACLFVGVALTGTVLTVRKRKSLQNWLSNKSFNRPKLSYLTGFADRFLDGLATVNTLGSGLVLGLISLALWGTEALGAWIIASSAGVALPWAAVVLLVAVPALGMILPAAPGFIGTYEFFTITALAPFGLDKSLALGLGTLLHAQSLFMTTLLGGIFWVILSASGVRLRGQDKP